MCVSAVACGRVAPSRSGACVPHTVPHAVSVLGRTEGAYLSQTTLELCKLANADDVAAMSALIASGEHDVAPVHGLLCCVARCMVH